MTMDKAVILARGLGTRMRRNDDAAVLDPQQQAMAQSGLKAMIPIGRPFLDYVLSGLADAGYRRVCLVVGPEHQAVRDYYHRGNFPAAGVAGVRRAAGTTRHRRRRGRGGNLLPPATIFLSSIPTITIPLLRWRPSANSRARPWRCSIARACWPAATSPPSGCSHFAVGKVDARGCLQRVIEKPDQQTWASLPRPIGLSMNCWRFGPAIFSACRAIRPSPRGELELPDAVQYAIDVLGEQFRALTLGAPVLDLTSRGDIAAVAVLLAGTEVNL